MLFPDQAYRVWGFCLLTALVLAPLGMWKLVDIVVWLFTHVRVLVS